MQLIDKVMSFRRQLIKNNLGWDSDGVYHQAEADSITTSYIVGISSIMIVFIRVANPIVRLELKRALTCSKRQR